MVTKDLPELLGAYDNWNSALLAAVANYDGKVVAARRYADIAYNAAVYASKQKLNATVAPFWTQDEAEKAALKQAADRASDVACKRDGIFVSIVSHQVV